jgi:hypothetical protein
MLTLHLNATGALWANDSSNFLLASFYKHIIKGWALERAGARDLCVMDREGAGALCVIERVGARDGTCVSWKGRTPGTRVVKDSLR